MSFVWRHHSLHSGALCDADPALLEAVLRCPGQAEAVVSTGGPGETGGTACSAEMRRSPVCSGTGKTPERCFGNSGENWSARKTRRVGVTDCREERCPTTAGQRGS